MRTVSFSMTDGQHALFATEAAARGLSVSQYCKTAAFSHLAKYASKGVVAEIIARAGKGPCGPTDVGSAGNLPGLADSKREEI